MKKLIGVIVIIIIFYLIVYYNKQSSYYSSYHSKSNKQLNYEKATKIIYTFLLEKNGIHPTQEKVNELAQNHIRIHNAVENLMFKENDLEQFNYEFMKDYIEEEELSSRSIAPR